jgi:hypothetical protein
MNHYQQLTEHIERLIQERENATKQNIIDSINDDIEYYENQLKCLQDHP